MVIVLLGASGAGKSRIENEISKKDYKKVVSYTTRKPREGEINHKDYHFISNDEFEGLLNNNLLAEHEEYSQNRLYGTAKTDYLSDENKVVVLTPNGLRQLKKNCPGAKIFSVLIEAPLGTRVKRYIDRCGVDKFNFDDKNEICSRVERDYGMFLDVDKEVDLVITNNEKTKISEVINEIMRIVNEKEDK